MPKVCYLIISILLLIIIFEFLKTITLREGIENPNGETSREKLWKDNDNMVTTLNNKITTLNNDIDDLENLKYIRENNPELLGTRVNDETFNIKDVIGYFKSGIDANDLMLKDMEDRAKNAIPKEENVNITGS